MFFLYYSTTFFIHQDKIREDDWREFEKGLHLSKTRCSKKYQSLCLQLKRELHKPLDDEIFKKAFELDMT